VSSHEIGYRAMIRGAVQGAGGDQATSRRCAGREESGRFEQDAHDGVESSFLFRDGSLDRDSVSPHV
jgi:hypothetical protein